MDKRNSVSALSYQEIQGKLLLVYKQNNKIKYLFILDSRHLFKFIMYDVNL